MRLLTPRHLMVIDGAVAVVMALVVAFAARDAELPSAVREPEWMSLLVGLVIACPISARRRWPVGTLATTTAGTVVALLTGMIPVVAAGAPLGVLVLELYMVGRMLARPRSLIVLAACGVAFVGASLVRRTFEPDYESWLDTVFGLSFFTVVLVTGWMWGLTAQVRQAYADRAVAQVAREAVARERLRIARELHDIVAHSMSLIAVKAGIGNHVADSHPSEAREALRVIEATSRSSLAEMRHLLGALRSEVDAPVLAPAAGVAALPDLASRAADAGVSVTVDVGDGELPDGVGLAVYRIVQESVTNVVRHAGPTRCRVTVEPGGEDVRVEVTNDGPVARARPSTGHGLIGMRERVAMYGGTFEAGPRPEGGFRVTATIPYGAP